MINGRWLVFMSLFLISCTDAVPEMGWLSKTTDMGIFLSEQVIYNNQVYIRKTDLKLHTNAGPDITGIAFSESPNCDSLSWQTIKTTYPITISSGDGNKTISYRFKSGEEEKACLQYHVTLDTTTPQAVSIQPSGDLNLGGITYIGANRQVDFNLSAMNATEMKISQNTSCSNGSWEAYNPIKSNFLVSGTDGNQNFSVMFKNMFQELTTCLNTSAFLDSTGPDIGSWVITYAPTSIDQVVRTQTPSFSWTAPPTDMGVGYQSVEYALGTTATNNNISSWQIATGLSGSITGLNLSVGTYYLNFRVQDVLGNIATPASRIIRVIPNLPTLSLHSPTSSPGNVAALQIAVAASSGQTVNIYDNATCTGALRGTILMVSTSSTITMSHLVADGSYNFYAEAIESGVSSGCTAIGLQYILDTTSPTSAVTRTGSVSGNSSSIFSWDIEFQGASGVTFTTAQIAPLGSTSGCVEYLTQNNTFSYQYRLANCSGYGPVGFQVDAGVAINASGNYNLAFSTGSILQANLTNEIRVDFTTSGDVVEEGTSTSNQTITVKASGSSNQAIRVWYEVLTQSPLLHTVLSSSYNLNNGYVDIPAGQTDASLTYQYFATGMTQGSRSLQVAIKGLSTTSGTAANPTTSHANLGNNQVFRRFISASDGSSQVQGISNGSRHSCLLTPTGGVKCWGLNTYGEVGNLTKIYETPTAWDGLSGLSYQAVVTGNGFTCGLTAAGHLRCSGNNSRGQFANGSTTNSFSVVDAGYTSGGTQLQFTNISASSNGVCGITFGTSILYCWGANEKGESGSPLFGVNILYAGQISSDTFQSVARGVAHTCAVLNSGGLRCWGDGTYGQIGALNATGTNSLIDPDPTSSNYVKVYSGGQTSCALDSNNYLRCWGRYITSSGTYSTSTYSSQARSVRSASQFRDVAIGYGHFCGVLLESGGAANSGRVICYGGNSFGQLGFGDLNTQLITNGFFVNNGEYFHKISAGPKMTCGLDEQNILKCWGDRSNALGDGSAGEIWRPQKVAFDMIYSSVSTGVLFTCALTSDQNLMCWGYNNGDQLGNNSSIARSAPQNIDPGVKYQKISVKSSTGCGITVAGVLKCWGYNNYGQVGNNTLMNTQHPSVINSGTLYQDVGVGSSHSCGITSGGTLKCWGNNSSGQLGQGHVISPITTPQVVDSGVIYTSISLGHNHTCGTTSLDTVKCWGSNYQGQLADANTAAITLTPTEVSGGTPYSKVFAGANSSCALNLTGALYCWGSNESQQIPGGVVITTPTLTHNFGANIVRAEVSDTQICTTNTQNQMHCTGDRRYSESGLTPVEDSSPVQIENSNNIATMAISASHSCFITTAGHLWCWGDNSLGSVGIGQADSSSPVAIAP